MKGIKRIMFIALMASIAIPMPQQATAQERKADIKVEKREKRKQRKPERIRAMRDSDFSMMYDIVKKSSFDDNKLDIIRVACIGSKFSSKQCARLLSLFSFDDNKLKALEIISPYLVETDNYKKIMNQFSFSSSKEKAAEILARR